MSSKPLARYIEIKQQIAALEAELEELRDSVFADVQDKGGQIEDEAWVIRSYKQPRYKFSETYESKNSELKELRKQEIDSGTAVVESYSEYVKLNFRKPKSE